MQTVIAALALSIAAKNAWPDLLNSQFLSAGALLLYALVGTVVVSFIWMLKGNRETFSANSLSLSPEVANPKDQLGEMATVDGQLRQENIRLLDQANALQNQIGQLTRELEKYRSAERAKEEQQKETEAALAKAPQLLVDYKRDGVHETLRFFNDRGETASVTFIGPVKWTETRRLEVPTPEPLTEKRSSVKEVHFRSGQGETCALDDFLRRECAGKKATVRIHYMGEKRAFTRDFELDAAADGNLHWQPDEVKLS